MKKYEKEITEFNELAVEMEGKSKRYTAGLIRSSIGKLSKAVAKGDEKAAEAAASELATYKPTKNENISTAPGAKA